MAALREPRASAASPFDKLRVRLRERGGNVENQLAYPVGLTLSLSKGEANAGGFRGDDLAGCFFHSHPEPVVASADAEGG